MKRPRPRGRCSRQDSQSRRGFIRREVVIAGLIGLLFLMVLFPYLVQQRSRSRRQFCQMRLINLAQAVQRYDVQRGGIPGYRNVQATDVERPTPISWAFPLLRYLFAVPPNAQVQYDPATDRYQLPLPDEKNQQALYSELLSEFGTGGKDAGQLPKLFVVELVCPADPPPPEQAGSSWLSYVANSGMPDAVDSDPYPADWPANGVFMDRFEKPPAGLATPVSLKEIESHDGLNYTLLFSENIDAGLWTDNQEAEIGFVWVANESDGKPTPHPNLLAINEEMGNGGGEIRYARPSSRHLGGVNVVYCSSAAQFVSQDIDYLVFAQLMMSDMEQIKRPGSDTLIPPPFRLLPKKPATAPQSAP